MNVKEFISLLLPKELKPYFKIVGVDETPKAYVLNLEELDIPPPEFVDEPLDNSRLLKVLHIHDLPAFGKDSVIRVKLRIWENTDTDEVVYRDWAALLEDHVLTEEFEGYLKD